MEGERGEETERGGLEVEGGGVVDGESDRGDTEEESRQQGSNSRTIISIVSSVTLTSECVATERDSALAKEARCDVSSANQKAANVETKSRTCIRRMS